jgi:RNA polymerase sigma factor (sigma-70 family)
MYAKNASDQQLLQMYSAGNENALEALIHRYKDKVYTSIFVMVRDSYLAEDIFQEVFIKVVDLLRKGKYDEQGKFAPWVLRIAHNMCIDHFRRVKSAPGVTITTSAGEDIFKFLGGEEDTPKEAFYDVERKEERLKLLIDQLPEEQREVLVLRHFHKFSYKEIAEMNGACLSTNLGRMRYAIINLRRLIEMQKVSVR